MSKTLSSSNHAQHEAHQNLARIVMIGMHAATRRAKTPRLKPAAHPWQALPRLADLFDRDAPAALL